MERLPLSYPSSHTGSLSLSISLPLSIYLHFSHSPQPSSSAPMHPFTLTLARAVPLAPLQPSSTLCSIPRLWRQLSGYLKRKILISSLKRVRSSRSSAVPMELQRSRKQMASSTTLPMATFFSHPQWRRFVLSDGEASRCDATRREAKRGRGSSTFDRSRILERVAQRRESFARIQDFPQWDLSTAREWWGGEKKERGRHRYDIRIRFRKGGVPRALSRAGPSNTFVPTPVTLFSE